MHRTGAAPPAIASHVKRDVVSLSVSVGKRESHPRENDSACVKMQQHRSGLRNHSGLGQAH